MYLCEVYADQLIEQRANIEVKYIRLPGFMMRFRQWF